MEECEVLCGRLAIMVQGAFSCLGSPLQLKEKYGGGYTLTVKVEAVVPEPGREAPGEQVKRFVSERLPAATLSEENVGLLRYRLGAGSDAASLATAFAKLEASTEEGGALHRKVSDYALSQTSLEEVFLHFS